jgi:hypothetical protein
MATAMMVSRLAAQPLVVAGSPGYDAATGTGFFISSLEKTPGRGVNDTGTAVGYGNKLVGGAARAIARFDGTRPGRRLRSWTTSGLI